MLYRGRSSSRRLPLALLLFLRRCSRLGNVDWQVEKVVEAAEGRGGAAVEDGVRCESGGAAAKERVRPAAANQSAGVTRKMDLTKPIGFCIGLAEV